jgi:hypothetical protein
MRERNVFYFVFLPLKQRLHAQPESHRINLHAVLLFAVNNGFTAAGGEGLYIREHSTGSVCVELVGATQHITN